MNFTKMHGQGNDFIMLGGGEAEAVQDYAGLSKRLCHRNFGIGGDGLVAVLPSETGDFTMRMFNPDGSEAEMCGNGIRCAAGFYIDKYLPSEKNLEDGTIKLSVETLAGIKKIEVERKNGKTGSITVDMGVPILEPAKIPTLLGDKNSAIKVPISAAGADFKVTCVSMGNPHAVIFLEDGDPDDIDINRFGPAIETHPAFPKKTNVEFYCLTGPDELKMRVWERGAGETLACGTGACATLVAAVLNGVCGKDRNVVIHLRGGDLSISWLGGLSAHGSVKMTGEAATVFEGSVEI